MHKPSQNNIGKQWWFEGLRLDTASIRSYSRCLQDVVKGIQHLKKQNMVFHRLLITAKYKSKSAVYINIFVEIANRVRENWIKHVLNVQDFETTLIDPVNKAYVILQCFEEADILIDEFIPEQMCC